MSEREIQPPVFSYPEPKADTWDGVAGALAFLVVVIALILLAVAPAVVIAVWGRLA
jgi:hypothetical protein